LRRILDGVADEVRSRGLVGEERLAQTLYLALTSRLLNKQVSAGVKGHSASGKSYTVETVTKFFPREAYLEFTAMSEKALIYSPEQYAHRTLIMYEVVAMREGVEDDMTSYFIRTLLSEGRIEYPVTVRDKDGGFTTKTIIKEGPTNLVFTTTKTKVHAENETRILSLGTDDSREQTARAFLELADEDRGASDLSDWQDLQRWLAGAEHRVTIPYARALVEKIPPVAVRLRRDVGSLLALIRAHAVLHQATRERDEHGRTIADLDDYAVVRYLVADIMAEGVGATVPETVRQIVEAVASIASKEGVQLRPLADKLNLDKSNVSRRLARAADGGYVSNLEDKKGKPSRWVIGDPLPETTDLLPEPAQLRNTAQHTDKDRCSVAADSGGESEGVAEPAQTNGQRRYDTCTKCGLQMRIIEPGQTTHPACEETPA
jgi:DNA-binding IclR family transcriptional regulator